MIVIVQMWEKTVSWLVMLGKNTTILRSSESSGMYCGVLNWMSTDVSEVRAASNIRALNPPTQKRKRMNSAHRILFRFVMHYAVISRSVVRGTAEIGPQLCGCDG
jgi:hypothetical protein